MLAHNHRNWWGEALDLLHNPLLPLILPLHGSEGLTVFLLV